MTKVFFCKNCNKESQGRSDSKNLFCSQKCSRTYTGFIGQIRNEILKNLNIELYNINPNKCTECYQTLAYSDRKNKFCSQSCSAVFSNKKRRLTGYKISKSSKIKISKTIHNKYVNLYMENPNHCVICQAFMPYEKRLRKTCSIRCLRKHNQTHGQKGGLISARNRPRRSKNEIAMYELCKNYFMNVTHNDPIFQGWDADILIHDYKIAILWNGDWHYKEMNCYNHSLKQVQNRDKYKSKLINAAGWSEYIIKDTSDHPTKPDIAFANLLQFLNLNNFC